ncbi:MAG: HDOD domain-containing protein [Planctomycetota bacterium]|nr:HDOD domain-containing protein [Planctomycetota bacterium]
MNSSIPHALLVDDTRMFRALARRRLEAFGIGCDEAATCEEAERLLNTNEYAILVTELHLPDRHAYHMVIDLLRRPVRPLIVIVTDIREPRLAQHLFDEGVDEIFFKPVDYALLAAKLKVRATRWQRQSSPAQSQSMRAASANESRREETTVTSEDLQTKLQHLTGMLPLSTTAFDVFNATRDNEYDTEKIERVIAKESSLAVELLRLANGPAYNASMERITSLDKAIVRVGRRKIGELALAHTAKTCLTQRVVPWLDVDLLWRRSIAASSAAELLTKKNLSDRDDTVVLAALMHGLGRVVLASLYPQVYEALLSKCEDTRESLDDLEEQCFPLSPGRVMARVLELWGLPDSVWRPLAHADTPDLDLGGRLLNSALALGNMATGNWRDFDRVTLPEATEAITSDGLDSILAQVVERQASVARNPSRQVEAKKHALIRYARVTPAIPDLPRSLLDSFGTVDSIPLDALEQTDRVVIDCREAAPYSLAPFVSQRSFDPRRIIIADRADASEFRRFGHVISFPLSYASLRHVCLGATPEKPSESPVGYAVPYQMPTAATFDAQR